PRVVEHTLSYAFASSLTATGKRAHLALATSSRPVADRLFFAGALRRPEVAAQLLLATAEVALRRFYLPPGMLARILRAADPLVTAADGRLRFESLSQCCGAYARADLLTGMLEAETRANRTRNAYF